jgi:hypothetical protein
MSRVFLLSLVVIAAASAFVPSVGISPTKRHLSTNVEPLSLETAASQESQKVLILDEEKCGTGTFINVAERLAQSKFAISPDDLVERTKDVIRKGLGLGDESVLAENFEFCAPVVGPINKEDYLQALRSFDLQGAFPDIDARYHSIQVDPFDHDRVWFQNRPIATHTGSLFGKTPTGMTVELPPQMNSLTFDASGKVKQLTIGYVLDRRVGNTGGLGGAFGFFYAVGQGLPIPECKPFKPSWQFRLLNWVGRIGNKLRK